MQTDIAAALPLGLYSVLVLTGVSAAPAADARPRPDLVVPSVADLIPTLARVRPDLME
jgi:ribonucleotide monophosphatase NagD (HAD superfamily)